MKKKCCLILLIALVISCEKKTNDAKLLTTGVSEELALYRSTQVSDVTYHLTFSIPERLQDSIPAMLTTELTINDLSEPLYFDFTQDPKLPLSIQVNNSDIPVTFTKEHLVIPTKYLMQGKNTIRIHFIAGEQSLNRNEDYLYTLLVPDRARTLFPCFDQPNIKANYELVVHAPKHWKVLGGGKLLKEEVTGGFKSHYFMKTDKMSTYLFSFVAGKFEAVQHTNDTFEMNMLFRETDAAKVTASTEAIFNLHQQALDFLEKYTDYKFPFQKFDFATIPGFQYGGMEHTGAIQYRESSLFLDSTATQSRAIRRAKLIAHETAHMWFGNLVTMQWFDDVWMKEVFANLMADKIINPAFPDINHELQFVTAHYPRAYGVDRTKGANAMRQNLANLNNAGSLYGSIIYNKAPIMMRQLETTLGAKAFQEGLANYIKTYANGNAEWKDLIAILDQKTALNLKEWSEVWVNSSGRPIIESHLSYNDKNTIESLSISQSAEDGSNKIWPQLFEIVLVYPDSIKKIDITLHTKKVTVHEAVGLVKPLGILYNSNGLGYGVFPIDFEQLDPIPFITDDLTRGYSYINLYENTLNGTVTLDKAFQLFQKGIATESNELILRGIISNIQNMYWRYLTPKQRLIHQISLEKDVLERLKKAKDIPRVTKALFNLFSNIAYSDQGKKTLYQIWDKTLMIPHLNLNTDDYTNLAMQLALYEHSKVDHILTQTKQSIKNPDKLKRFEFLLPSLSSNETTRANFFLSFKDEKNRAKENWVLTANNYLHHPLRQRTAIAQLALSLDLLEEIQQTGDIFFPKGWLDGTIGSYSNKEALVILDAYLEKNPDLNPQLKMKLLQATDHLSRAQTLLNALTKP